MKVKESTVIMDQLKAKDQMTDAEFHVMMAGGLAQANAGVKVCYWLLLPPIRYPQIVQMPHFERKKGLPTIECQQVLYVFISNCVFI